MGFPEADGNLPYTKRGGAGGVADDRYRQMLITEGNSPVVRTAVTERQPPGLTIHNLRHGNTGGALVTGMASWWVGMQPPALHHLGNQVRRERRFFFNLFPRLAIEDYALRERPTLQEIARFAKPTFLRTFAAEIQF